MNQLDCHGIRLVNGGSHVSIDVKIPTFGTILCVDLISQILLGQLNAVLFAQTLMTYADQFNGMRVTSVSVILD